MEKEIVDCWACNRSLEINIYGYATCICGKHNFGNRQDSYIILGTKETETKRAYNREAQRRHRAE